MLENVMARPTGIDGPDRPTTSAPPSSGTATP